MLPLFSNCCNYWVGDVVFQVGMGGEISKNNVLNMVHAMQKLEKYSRVNMRLKAQAR